MKKEITPEQREMAVFKGLYIEEFLRIEYFLEQIIVRFFLDNEKPENGFIIEEQGKLENAYVRIRNYQIRFFFEHAFFLDPFFGVKQKIDCTKTIIQLLNGNFYQKLKNKKPNVFVLIEKLAQLRNIIAHNISFPHEHEMVIGKFGSKFEGVQKKEVGEDGKTKIKDDFIFKPIANKYVFPEKIKDELFLQLSSVQLFLRVYFENSNDLNKNFKTTKHEDELHQKIIDLIDLTKALSNVGVFTLIK
ncbi:MAG: hypothetical protein ABI723_21135 [Bacteroidia bacterium]